MVNPLRIAVLLSGSGMTLQNLLNRIMAGTLSARVVQVVSSRPGVKGIDRARAAGLAVEVITRKECIDSAEFSHRYFDLIRAAKADLVCLAGFLQFLPIPDDFRFRVINIHPSLLPAFGGKGMYGHYVHEAVIAFGAKITGCTVHFADNEYDHGPIILQRTAPVLDDDAADDLAARVFEQECIAFPEAIQLIAEHRLRRVGRRVQILPATG